MLILLFTCASCKKGGTPQQDNTTQPSNVVSTEAADTSVTLSPEEVKSTIVGTWVYDEIVTPQNFYGEHYDSEITKTNITMRTIYVFGSDGTFSTGVTIVNMDDVKREYKSLMVEGARKEAESQGKYLSTANVTFFENRAEQILDDICQTETGTYVVNGQKIVYTLNGVETEETFTMSSTKLTVKGVKDNSYSITLIKQ